ncbi:MLO-like protein 1 [Mangifera indica]|uniref:MLO-like protein 1 n=1 Tax=Mangifera indica TaxID=29780 RepID=UPI001CFB0D8E|nr:MLO-like protein 1 [Mangifera indica]
MSGEGATLEYTPTWIVALVCTVMVVASMAAERFLHHLGKLLKRKNQTPLFQALQKIKEELMLLGFISLLLTVCQNVISEICISETLAKTWLPCTEEEKQTSHWTTSHLDSLFSSYVAGHGVGRHLSSRPSTTNYCAKQGKVPLLSTRALHHLHIFIFALAVAHVTFCALTVLSGGAKISQWKQWEDDIAKEYDQKNVLYKFTHVHEHDFIKDHFQGVGKIYAFRGWWHAFFMQFLGSVTKSDYTTLRLSFIMNHCRSNPKFNFHNYVMRSFEADFKKVVGIGWYCWMVVVLFLLVNVHDLHAYFWVSFIPLTLLLAVGTKLEHIITELATEVAQKHMAVEGDLIVKPSDHHFWLNRPKFVLLLIHITLFQNSFEIAVFIWIWVQYGFNSCIMGNIAFIIPRLLIGAFVQFICSYSTLPLYAIVARMGSNFKGSIFNEQVQEGLISWAKEAKKKVQKKESSTTSLSPARFLANQQKSKFMNR